MPASRQRHADVRRRSDGGCHPNKTPWNFEVASELAIDGPPPLVVLTSSREASAYGPRLSTSPVLGFIPKDELSGAAIRTLVDAG
jgi:hypothetical protein